MDEMVLGELRANFDLSAPGSLSVTLAGRSASPDAEVVLAPLFERVAASARAGGRVVVLRFEALQYFNSSTIAALVQFIRAAQVGGIGLEIVYDGRKRWQAVSFDALRSALRPPGSSGAAAAVTFRDS